MKEETTKKIWKRLDIILIFISLVLSFFVYRIISSYYSQSDKVLEKIVEEKIEEEKVSCSDCVERHIDGVLVKENDNIFPIAIAIENHIDARPQAGLSRANLVIEAEVEGGITRFLAFFAEKDKPGRIGPIRSARPYFIDWAEGLSSLYVHVGGSPEALVKIIKENVLDLNEFYNEKYFWRDNINNAPHNVFTSGENMNKYLEKRGLDRGDFISWQFKDEYDFDQRGDSSIKVNFERELYKVEWKYNKEDNTYVRFTAGNEHRDESGDLIKAKNIIVAYMDAKVLDEKLRLKINNIGAGKSIVCRDGDCLDSFWEKKTPNSRMRFYDKFNNEIKFNRGISWIEVLKPEISVEYLQ